MTLTASDSIAILQLVAQADACAGIRDADKRAQTLGAIDPRRWRYLRSASRADWGRVVACLSDQACLSV
jgi:hypothetical protein